jgi:D-arabinose 1-dehydrogenase-like Zn-dependent alcohol dehydrogenase
MRSIGTTEEFGVPGSIDDREAPRPGASEIAVAIQGAGVDAIDAVVVAGTPR